MYLLVLFFPFIGALITGLLGRYIGRSGSLIITTSCLFFSFIISLFIFFEVGLSNSICLIKLTS
jgi:NADH-ubiquinone oxidoreductase chain 5